jgi:hypothetical protein
MRRMPALALAGLTAIALSLPATAAPAAGDGPRFTFEKTPDGIVRMDTRTGEMSLCREQSGDIVCRGGGNDDQSLRGEVDALRHRVDALQKRLDDIETKLNGQALDVPDEHEFERGLHAMDRFFNHFMGMMKNWQTQFGEEPENGPPAPDSGPQKQQPSQPL